MQLHVGTSGYSYKEWKGSFYPEKLAAKDMLSYYADRLPAVEINNTFYRLPKESVLDSWAQQVPAQFRFSVKASRRITHLKRLKDVEDETSYLLRTTRILNDKLGVILYQLPPNLKKDMDRLRVFVDLLDPTEKSVFEFRHESWADDEVTDLLREKQCAICMSDTDEAPDPPLIPTTNWGYLRLRRAEYDQAQLSAWLKRLEEQGWDEVFVFFKHEDGGTGPRLAGKFLELADY